MSIMNPAGKQVLLQCDRTAMPDCRHIPPRTCTSRLQTYRGHFWQRHAHSVTGASWCAANDDGINHKLTIMCSIHPPTVACSPLIER
jgi:hypothetical protein